jgi:AcrR family transcriptional regulator
MELEIKMKMNERLFLRDPESTDLGKKIVRQGIQMINEIGFEDATFRKLASEIGTTEAGIYRYFENKHRLLTYLIALYWNQLHYQVLFTLHNMQDPEQKIKVMLSLISQAIEVPLGMSDIDHKALFQIVVAESSKAYLTKEVTENNKAQMFKPYKDLCSYIASLFLEYAPKYAYPNSLASSLIEISHMQSYFMKYLPSLTNFGGEKSGKNLEQFLNGLCFSSLNMAGQTKTAKRTK